MKQTPLRPGPGPRRRRDLAHGSAPLDRAALERRPMQRRPRKASETERAHGPAERREWMKAQPCVVCGRVPSDAAHVKSGGTGRKDDAARSVPLCADDPRSGYLGHHAEYDGRKHAGGKRTFAARYPHLDLPALAAETHARWLDYATRSAA